MEIEIPCGLSSLHGTPVFVLPYPSQDLKRVFGATFFPAEHVWRFPAFFPYCEDVVRDLEIVVPGVKFSEKALAHIETCRTLASQGLTFEAPPGFEFVTKPYAHQLEGLAFVLRNLRCGLFYDMGLGKTKVITDMIRLLRRKTLVLSPTVGIGTWLAEVAKHGPELKVMALTGHNERGQAAGKERNLEKRELQRQIKVAEKIGMEAMALQKLKDTLKNLPGAGIVAKYADIEAAAEMDVVVVSYDTAKRYQQYILEKLPYEIIVADESHALRTPNSDRTKAAVALSSKAARRVILSGTPSLGNPLHLYGQLEFLGKYLPAKDSWTFRRHYMIHAKGQRKVLLGFKNLDILHDKVARICTRKKKEECLDLPPRTIIDVPFELAKVEKELYNDIVEGTLIELQDGTLYEPNHAAAALQKLLQVLSGFIIKPPPPVCDDCNKLLICAPAKIKPFTTTCPRYPYPREQEIERLSSNGKLDALEELLEGILGEERNKVIIWGFFTEELNMVAQMLKRREWRYIRVDGSNSNKAQELSAKFNSDPTQRVWLAQVGTGVALTLTAATYMVYYGLTWKLDEYLQSMDRNFRIGQTQPTFVYRLLAPRSIGEFVCQALSAKLDVAEILTDRIDCLLCEKAATCVVKGTKPFETDCIYKSRVSRKVIRPGKL